MKMASRVFLRPLGLALSALCLSLVPAAHAQLIYTAMPSAEGSGSGGFTPSSEASEGAEGEGEQGLGGLLSDMGRLPVRLSFSVREGFNDNLYTSRYNRQSSWYTNFGAGARYDFGTPRFRMTANLGGGLTYYYTRPGNKVDLTGILQVSARYLATERLTLSFSTSTGYYSQADVGIVGGTDRQNGDYFYSNSTVAASYQWTRKFATVTGYNLRAFYYLEQALNQSQGRLEQTISQSFRYQVVPKIAAVAEYRANPVTYYYADLNSFGNFGLLGFDYIFNPRSTWSVRGGVEQRFNNNPVDGQSSYVGPFAESILGYQFASRSSLQWVLRYGTEASGLTNVTQRQTFRTGLTLSHGWTSRLSTTVGVIYQYSMFDQPHVIDRFNEHVINFVASANYNLIGPLSLSAGYNLTTLIAPSQSFRDYTQNIVFVGMNANF